MLYESFSKIKPSPSARCSITRRFQSKPTPTTCPHQEVTSEDVDWDNARPYKEIPGPSRLQLIRWFLPGGIFYKKQTTDFFKGFQKMYGDIALMPGFFGKSDILMAFDPNIFRMIFRHEGIWPIRKSLDSQLYFRQVYKKDAFRGVEGLVMSSGKAWGDFRTAVNPILMQPKNAKQFLTKMLPVSNEFLTRIREIRDPDTLEMPDTFVDEINRLAFESVGVIALDQELGLIRRNPAIPEAEFLFKSFDEFFDLSYVLDVLPSFWKIIKTSKFHRMMEVCDNIFQTTTKFIEDSLARIEQNPHSEKDDNLKSVVEKLGEKDKLFAIVMAMDMLIAGVATTTTTLTGILLGIAKSPEKQKKLRDELRTILPEKDSIVSWENMKHLPYLRACIKEGIRMYPIGPGGVRSMTKNIVLDGYQVPKGTDVVMANNYILRDARYFLRPDEFIPERWLRTAEGDSYKPDEINPFVYLPFGFGPRSCVGKRIVELELELTVMRLVRNFHIEFNYSIENAFDTKFLVIPVIPLKFKFAELED